ncbi:hypothetical protein ACTFIY_009188 [Dictyostelium cf. discoideum]
MNIFIMKSIIHENTRKEFQSLSSNKTYHNENSFNRIKQCELDALKNQEESTKMLMFMKFCYSSFSSNFNSPMFPSCSPNLQLKPNFSPSQNITGGQNSNADTNEDDTEYES